MRNVEHVRHVPGLLSHMVHSVLISLLEAAMSGY